MLSLHFYFVIEGISYSFPVPVFPVVPLVPVQNSPQPQLHQLSIRYSWWCFGIALQNLDKGEVGYPATICLGPSEIEKSTAIKAALSYKAADLTANNTCCIHTLLL